MRDITARAANATDQEVAALALEAWSARRLATFEDAERGLLFGRLDFEAVEQPALRRPPLGARRRRRPGRRQLAGARREAVLHRHSRRSTARHAPAPLPGPGPAAARHRRRVARRDDARRRLGRRLPARGARAQPRLPYARHRRDDPGRPVPADHPRSRPPACHPGRTRYGQDRRRAAPGVLAHLHRARAERAQPRARRRPEPHVHGVRLARAAGARRRKRRAARRRRTGRRRDADPAGRSRSCAAEGGPSDGGPRRPRGRAPARRLAGGAEPQARRRVHPRADT